MSRVQIADLREKRARLFEQMKDVNDKALGEERDFTAEEQQSYDRIEADFDAATRAVERLERIEGIEPTMTRAAVQAQETTEIDPEARELADKPELTKRQMITEKPEYRAAFREYLRRGQHVSAESRAALQVGTDSEGGYLVPDEFWNKLVEAKRVFGVTRQIATVFKTSANGQVLIPAVAAAGTAAWTAEEAAYTESEDTFSQVTMDAWKAGTVIKASDELIEDSAFDIASFVARRAGQAIAILENTAFVAGDGSSKPRGYTVAGTTGKTTAGATAITADELIDLFHSVIEPYRVNGTWTMRDATAAYIRKLKDSDGQYIWQPGLKEGTPDVLLGRPVKTDPDVPAIATGAETVAFGDFASGYWIRDVEGVTLKVLNELYAVNGQVGYRVHSRVDGDMVDSAAFRLLSQA